MLLQISGEIHLMATGKLLVAASIIQPHASFRMQGAISRTKKQFQVSRAYKVRIKKTSNTNFFPKHMKFSV